MASYLTSLLLPPSSQKRLLKYILTTYVPALDPSTLDLDKLDVAIGRKSTISLSDVGVDGAKLHTMLLLPPELKIDKAKISSLNITLPADLHRSGIEVFIDGVVCSASLTTPEPEPATKSSSKRKKDAPMAASVALPTPEEAARQFWRAQPRKLKKKLERSVIDRSFSENAPGAAGFWSSDEEDNDALDDDEDDENEIPPPVVTSRRTSGSSSHSNANLDHHPPGHMSSDSEESSDESDSPELGTGTGLSLPGFIASFIKGVGDRVQLHVGKVAISLQIPRSLVFPDSNGLGEMTLELRVASVAIEGVTFASAEVDVSAFAAGGSGQLKEGKRKVQVNRLGAWVVGEEGWFDEEKKGEGLAGMDGGVDTPMKESVCTVKDAAGSVDTLKGLKTTPAPAPPRTATSPVPAQRRPSSSHSHSSDDSDAFLDAEDTALAASVLSLGSSAGSSSNAKHMSESQMFADAESDSDSEGDRPHLPQTFHESQDGPDNEELLFSMASYKDTMMHDVDDVPYLADLEGLNRFYTGSEPSGSGMLEGVTLPSPRAVSPAPRPSFAGHLSFAGVGNARQIKPVLNKSSPALIPMQPTVRRTNTSGSQVVSALMGGSVSELPSPGLEEEETPGVEEKPATPRAPSPAPSVVSTTTTEESEDEVAQEQLSRSMFFSHEDAGSLYMSAMSADFHSTHPDQHLDGTVDNATTSPLATSRLGGMKSSGGHRKGELPGEELTEAELDARLDRLTGVLPARTPSPPTQTEAQGGRKMQKLVAEVDYVQIWLPALSVNTTTAGDSPPESRVGSPGMKDTHPHLPGSFGARSQYSSSPGSVPKKMGFGERWTSPDPSPSSKEIPPQQIAAGKREKDAEVEVFVGKVSMKTDLVVGGVLARIMGLLGGLGIESASKPSPESTKTEDEKASTTAAESKKKLELVVGEVDLRLVDRLWGQLLSADGLPKKRISPEDDEPRNGETILDANVQHIRTVLSSKPQKESIEPIIMTKITLDTIELRDTHGAFVKFLPTPPGCITPPQPKKQRGNDAPTGGADVMVLISTVGKQTKINVETLPLHVQLQLARVDELLTWFGGFGSVLGLSVHGALGSGRETPVPQNKEKGKSVSWKEPGGAADTKTTATPSTEVEAETKIVANVGGLVIDLEGEDAALGLRTSVIKIRKKDNKKLLVGIEKIALLGPDLVNTLHDSAATVVVDSTRLELSTSPTEDDLARLLKLLTPSKDKFGHDDDIMLDMLFKQRRQGSVFRISSANVHVNVDSVRECERFPALGDELTKLLTVTKYIPQDERPGPLTLLYVRNMGLSVFVNDVVGEITADVGSLDLSHVSGPNLLALAMGTIRVARNKTELLGESLPKQIAVHGFAGSGDATTTFEDDRPMVMVRMLGDDPEPVVKVKLWNVKAEYKVDTLLALMNSPDATGEEVAREMVDSIATLTERQVRRELRNKSAKMKHVNSPLAATLVAPTVESTSKPVRVEIAVRDSVLGLNPLDLSSKALIVLSESRFFVELPSADAELELNVEIKRASILLVDDVRNLYTPEDALAESKHRRRRPALTEHLAAHAELGYVSVATISSARAVLKLVESEVPGDKCVDLEVSDELFFMETCADSTQTLLGVINGLKPPLPEGEEIKYRTEVMDVDMFASMLEDAFSPMSRNIPAGMQEAESLALPERGTGKMQDIREEDDELPRVGDMSASAMSGLGGDDANGLTIMEDYYGAPSPPPKPIPSSSSSSKPKNKQSDSLLDNDDDDEDLLHISTPPPKDLGERAPLPTFEEQVQMLDDGPLKILDNHFSVVPRASLIEMAANSAIGAPVRVKVKDVHVIWNLHDGYDWPRTRDAISKAVKKVESRAIQRRGGGGGGVGDRRGEIDADEDEQESVIGDLLFNSIYIGIPANRDPKELARQINSHLDAVDGMSETGSYASTALESSSRPSSSRARSGDGKRLRGGLKLARSRQHKMQIELKGLSVDFVLFPQNGGETQSSVDLRVRDMEIIDNVPTSTWKKFVTYMRDAGKRETGSQMAHVEVLSVKPVPALAASELVIKATILPLRLHVDQDTLDFLTRFFEFKDDTAISPSSPQEEPFIQRIEVNSVRVKLDYKPKRVDYVGLRSGHTTEFMNFIILEEADMVLRHVILHGISGFTKLSKGLNDTWMPDIQRTQLGDVLSGVAPVRSLVNLGSGVKDLVVVPMREYRKDGRIMRSVSKGMVSFASKTTRELVRLGAKVAVGTQTVLENTEEFLGGQGSGARADAEMYNFYSSHDDVFEFDVDESSSTAPISLYADQPKNVAQGLRNAGSSLRRNLAEAREALRQVPQEVAERGSAQGVVSAVARAAPVAVLRPMIGASEAVSRTLLGVTNSLDKEMVRRVDDKYKRH